MRSNTNGQWLALVALLALGCGSPAGAAANGSAAGAGGQGGAAGSAAAGAGGSAGAPGGAGGAAPVVDQVISTPASSSSEHEPSIAVTPDGRVVAAWIAFETASYQIAYRVSPDGGGSWGDVQLLPLDGDQNIAANTSLSAAPDGTVYLAYGAEHVDATGTRSHVGVYLAKLAPGAAEFSTPVEITDPKAPAGVYDQPFVAVTSKGLFLAYGEFSANLTTSRLTTRFSPDGGKSWSVSSLSTKSLTGFMNGVQLCRPPSGDRAYLYAVDSDLGLALWRSDDGGKSWSSPIQVEAAGEQGGLTYMREGNCVADGDDVYILYGLSDDLSQQSHNMVAPLSRLVLAHSADGGKSISSRTDVGDKAAGSHYLLSRLASEGGGVLDLTYYAGSGEGDAQASYRFARSTDRGKSFGPSIAIRTPVLYELKRTTEQWLGDYMGLVWQGGRYYSAFVDNSAPAAHVVVHSAPTP